MAEAAGAGVPGPAQTWLGRHQAALVVAAAYLYVFPYFGKLNSPNENVRIWMTRAIVAHGTLAIDEVEREWGEVGDRAAANDRHYSSKAPGVSLAGVPVLAALHLGFRALGAGEPGLRATTWALRVFCVVLPLCWFFAWFGRRVERVTGSPRARDLLVIGLGVGTMLYPYGLTFAGHAPGAALMFAGFLAVANARGTGDGGQAGSRRFVLAGLLAGLAVLCEYQNLLAAAVVAVYAMAVHRQRALLLALGAAGPAVVLAGYHTALFGRPWEMPYGHLDDAAFRLYHHTAGFLGLHAPRAKVLRESLVSVDFGLFVFSPLVAVGLGAAAVTAIKVRSRDAMVVLGVTGVMLLFLAGLSNHRGGWSAGGPRYIAVVVPFAVWSVATSWSSLFAARAVPLALVAGSTLASVFMCGLAGAVFPHFPQQFDNPVFEVAVRLLYEGFAPRSLGGFLGLPGALALAPLGLAIVAVLARALLSPGQPRLVVPLAVGLAVLLLVFVSRHGRSFDTAEEADFAFVRSVWEPPHERP